MSKRLFVILFTGILILSLAACGGTSKNRATADASANGTTVDSGTDVSDQLYVFVAGQTKLEYMQKHKAGFEAACAALGVQGKFFGPDDSNIEEMTNAFEQAIAMKPNGIIICPLSDFGGMTTKALEAGIPVVYVDIDYADNDRISYAGTGDEALAEMGGEYLMDILNGEGKIAELYIPDTETGIRRSAAYEAVFARYPGVEVVARGNTKADYEIAAQAAAAILQANPDLDAFVCIDSTGGIGAATALREAGMEGQVKIISMDTDQETLSLIKDGVIDATLAQNTQLMILYHFNFGYPLLDENVELLIPHISVKPQDGHSREKLDERLEFSKPTAGSRELSYFYKLCKDQNGQTFAGIYNHKLGFGVVLEFDGNVLDHFLQWKLMKEGEYVLGLEPANATTLGAVQERNLGHVKYLEPGETRDYRFTVRILEGCEDLNRMRKRVEDLQGEASRYSNVET